MVQINTELAQGVKAFLDSGDRGFLATMQGLDRNDIEGQATIRYLMQLKHWPFTPDSEFAGLLNHFFGAYPDRKSMTPEDYQKTTFDMIKSAFDYECVVVVPEPKPEAEAKKPNPGKRTSKPRMQSEAESLEEGESGSRTFKSINQSEQDA